MRVYVVLRSKREGLRETNTHVFAVYKSHESAAKLVHEKTRADPETREIWSITAADVED